MGRLDLGVGIVVFPDLLPLLDDIGDLVDLYVSRHGYPWLRTISVT